jgi:hypothetical protein
MRGLTKLGPEPEASLRDGGIIRFSDHHVERTKAVFGSDLVGEWSARQQAGQGQLLVAEMGSGGRWIRDVGLGWAARPGTAAPETRVLVLAADIEGSKLSDALSRTAQAVARLWREP